MQISRGKADTYSLLHFKQPYVDKYKEELK